MTTRIADNPKMGPLPPRQTFFVVGTLVLAGIMLQTALSQAQVPTSITSSGLGTTVSQAGTTYNITGGTRNGSNLFHSFGLFNVGAGDTANFNNTTVLATTNILGRVSGGQTSNIFGRIQTTNFGGANLFLINPAGWLFAPTASLNVGGAFHASTANYVGFPDLADGTKVRFVADTSPLPASGLTANPTAFGFLGPNFAGITVQGSHLAVTAGNTLSLIGGNIQIIGPAGNVALGPLTATLGAASSATAGRGRVQLASVASPGEVFLSPNLGVSSPQLGRIDVSNNARIDVSGNPGGTVVIRGGQLIASQSSQILTATTGSTNGARTAVDIQVSGDMTLAGNSTIETRTTGLGAAGDIFVDVGTLSITGGSSINTITGQAPFFIGGLGGDVTVTAKESISISDANSRIRSSTDSGGFGGKVTISAPSASLALANGGRVESNSSRSGAGGDIAIDVRSLSIASGGNITSLTGNAGHGGTIGVNASNAVVIDSGSGLFSNAGGTGAGGDINVQAAQVQLLNGATISANSTGTETANAGNVNIITSDLTMQNGSITTATLLADGGNVSVTTTGSLVHLTNSQITTSVGSGVGSGSNIAIDSQFLILNNSRILANSFGGPGGNLNIKADFFLVNSGGMIPTSLAGIIDASSSILGNFEATFTNVTGSVTRLPETPLQATELLRASCAARFAGGKGSSLVFAGRGGIPLQPGDLLPSPVYLASEADTPSTGNNVTGQDLPTRFSLLGPKDRFLNQYSLLPNAKCSL